MQIYWYVFWGDDGDSDTARQVLGAGVDDMALTFKYSLCEDEHCADNGFWRRKRLIIFTQSSVLDIFDIVSWSNKNLYHLVWRCWALHEPSGPLLQVSLTVLSGAECWQESHPCHCLSPTHPETRGQFVQMFTLMLIMNPVFICMKCCHMWHK